MDECAPEKKTLPDIFDSFFLSDSEVKQSYCEQYVLYPNTSNFEKENSMRKKKIRKVFQSKVQPQSARKGKGRISKKKKKQK